jgi:hypothetical protein
MWRLLDLESLRIPDMRTVSIKTEETMQIFEKHKKRGAFALSGTSASSACIKRYRSGC